MKTYAWMTATAISKRVSRISRVNVMIAVVGSVSMIDMMAVEISWISRWPAVRFAVKRTPRANGRINKLIVSIIIRAGMSGFGVPSGRRCPSELVGWFRRPTRMVAIHSGSARAIFIDSWVVGVKV